MATSSLARAGLTTLVTVGFMTVICGSDARAQSLTYQGQLKLQGQPANMNVDLRFTLHSVPTGDAPVGTPVDIANQPVIHGLFTVELSFGAGAFNGNERWLQVEVRPTGDIQTPFTALTPRQHVTAVPYALYAFVGPGGSGAWQAAGADIHNTNTGNVGIGTDTPTAKLQIADADGQPGIEVANNWFAIRGTHNSTNGTFPGVWGDTDSLSSGASGVRGIVNSTSPGVNSTGVLGVNNGTGASGAGVTGRHAGAGAGVQGEVSNGSALSGRFIGGRGVRVETNLSGGPDLDLKGTANSGLAFDLGSLNFLDGQDTNFGGVLYRRTLIGDRLVFSVGQQERVYVDQNGRVGINEATPLAPLHVASTEDAAPTGGGAIVVGVRDGRQVTLDDNEIMARSGGDAANLYVNHNGGNVLIDDAGSGRLGVGTATPTAKLDVNGSAHVSGDLDVDGNLNVRGATTISIGYEVVTNSREGDGGSENISVGCPPGKKVLGGGCFHSGNSGTLTASHPAGDSGWACFWDDTQGGGHIVQAEAICANIN